MVKFFQCHPGLDPGTFSQFSFFREGYPDFYRGMTALQKMINYDNAQTTTGRFGKLNSIILFSGFCTVMDMEPPIFSANLCICRRSVFIGILLNSCISNTLT